MDEMRWPAVGIGLLIAAGAIIVGTIRSRSVNKADPLQARLAGHLDTYARSPKDDAAFDQLKAGLTAELKGRSVPKDEWDFRVSSASGLVDPALSRQHLQSLVDAITRLNWSR
ncbi:hypothetical protein GCM10009422_10750 [Brevundimonas kwangchunensis]|uniref:Uncharacterized protein n=1 Tax=Brevundimonas kwangchunensis TaxID=322163 RepID=A0ABN1GRJ1_9CAUL